MKIPPSTECQGCGKQIGTDDYVVCQDGIAHKIVAFHHRCQPKDPDLQRHHSIGLAPLKIGVTVQDMPIGGGPEFPTISYRLSNKGDA